jgi:hypothetical protein
LIVPVVKVLTIFEEEENWGDTEDDFWLMVQADIGPKDDRGAETFTLYVTSPKRLSGMLGNGESQIGRGLLIMNDFKKSEVEKVINRLLNNCKRNTWEEVELALCRYFYWEFDE